MMTFEEFKQKKMEEGTNNTNEYKCIHVHVHVHVHYAVHSYRHNNIGVCVHSLKT